MSEHSMHAEDYGGQERALEPQSLELEAGFQLLEWVLETEPGSLHRQLVL